jgi:hypothetical protein
MTNANLRATRELLLPRLISGEPSVSANPTGRFSSRELVLPARFRAALKKLNPLLPPEALQEAELAVTANRSAMLPVAANRDVYQLLREGISVQVRHQDGCSARGVERGQGTAALAGQRRCRTAAAECTAGCPQAPRRVIGMPSSMDTTRLKQSRPGARLRSCCGTRGLL